MDYPQERQYPAILKEAVRNDIVVNAVQAGDMAETTPIWKEIAQFGHGRYIAIPQSGGEVVVIITPYDEDILHMQRMLDESVLPYGGLEKRAEIATKMKEKAEAPASVKIDNSKYYSKRSATKEVITGGGDLISDLRNKKVELDKIDDTEMPKELQAKSKPERQAWIDARLEARQNLETHMADLIAKRDAYVLDEQKKSSKTSATDSFDRAVEDTLKTQLN